MGKLESGFSDLYYIFRCLKRRTKKAVLLLLLLIGGEGLHEIWNIFTDKQKAKQKTSRGEGRSDVEQIAIQLFDSR